MTDLEQVAALIRSECKKQMAFHPEVDFAAVDAAVYRAFPRITPAEEAAAWRAYVTWAKQDAAEHEAEAAAFSAWVDEQKAKGRPESELVYGAFVEARYAH
jgi:hypothetical protein